MHIEAVAAVHSLAIGPVVAPGALAIEVVVVPDTLAIGPVVAPAALADRQVENCPSRLFLFSSNCRLFHDQMAVDAINRFPTNIFQ